MSDIKLGDYLNTLYPQNGAERIEEFHTMFQLCQDIFNISKISNVVECIFRLLFLIINDIFIVTLPYKLKWFTAFESTDNMSFSKILVILLTRQSALFVILLMCFILIMEISIFATYDPVKHLSEKTATFLNFVIVYLSPICSLLMGLVLGCFLLCDAGDMSNIAKNVYGILVTFMFLFISLSYYIFILITKYSIVIKPGNFASFEPPYGITDLIYFYCLGTSFPCRSSGHSYYYYYSLIFTVLSVFWSIYKFMSRRRYCYVSSFANFVDLKVIADTFVYSIASFFFIVFEHKYDYSALFSEISYQIITLLIVFVFFYIYKYGKITKDNGEMDLKRCKTAYDATSVLRIGISFGFKETATKKFIKWALAYKFEPQIIPDVVRFALIMKIPLNEFIIPYFSTSLPNMISLKFLAFQVQNYNNCLYDDDNPIVKSVIDKINREIKLATKISDDFWTDRDYEELTIEKYGQRIDKITKFIQSSVLTFPNSNEIRELWEMYVTDIIFSEKNINMHVNFETIKYPGKTIYGFLNHKTSEEVSPGKQQKAKSSTEQFVKSYSKKLTNPFLFFIKITFIVLFIYIALSYILFLLSTKNVYDVYSRIIYKTIISLSFPVKLISSADSIIVEKNKDMNDFKLTKEQLQLYQEDIIINYTIYSNTFKYIQEYLSTKFQVENEFCNYLPISSIANVDFDMEWDNEKKKCYITWAEIYSKLLVDDIVDEVSYFNYDSNFYTKVQKYFFYCYILIFPIIFIFFIFYQKYHFNNLVKCIINIVSINGEFIHHGNYKIAFGPLAIFIYFILTSCFAIVLVFSYKKSIRNLYNNNIVFHYNFADIVDVCRLYLLSYSYIGAQEAELFPPDYINEKLRNYSRLILDLSYNVSVKGVPSRALKFEGFRNWYNETFLSLSDYSQYLKDFINDPDDKFVCTAIRYILGSKLKVIVSESIPSMIRFLQFFNEIIQNSFWYYSLFLFLFVGILWLIIGWIKVYQISTLNGFKTLIKRAHSQHPQQVVYMIVNTLNSKNDYFDDIPMPFVIRNSDGIILAANQMISSAVGCTNEQIIGQPYDEYFDENGPKNTDNLTYFTCDVTKFKNNLELVIFHNNSKIKEEQNKIDKILNQMTPEIPNDNTIQEMIYIECRINPEALNAEYIFSTFSELSAEFPEIKCIACGVTFYNCYSYKGNEEEVARFLSMFCDSFINNCILAATFGEGYLLSLTGKGPLFVMIGKLSERAHELTTNYGLWNRIYVDFTIIEQTSIADDIELINENKEYKFIIVSPTSK